MTYFELRKASVNFDTSSLTIRVRTDNWNARAYRALSIASTLSIKLRAHAAVLSLAREVWKLDDILREFLEEIYTAAEHGNDSPQELNEDEVREAAQSCIKIHAAVGRVFQLAKQSNLLNRRFIGMAFNSVKARAEEFLDIGDALELSLDPQVDALLDRSVAELERGEAFDFPVLQ